MHSKILRRLTFGSFFTLSFIAMGLSACGSSSSSGPGTSVDKNIILASELPTSGSDQAVGTATQNGVQMAVQENSDLGSGYKLTFMSFNDASVTLGKHDPNQGQANMQQIVANKEILAVVGPFNSGVAAAEIPLINAAGGPVEISPSNTNPGLTISQYATANGFDFTKLHPAGKPDYYFRIPANDVIQGTLLAKIATTPAPTSIGAKTAFVLDDGEVYGQGLSDFFTAGFMQFGGTILGTRTSISKDQCTSFTSLATTIVSLKPDTVFFGGTTGAGAGCLKQAVAKAGGAAIPWLFGDGVADNSDWFNEAGTASPVGIGTVAAPDLSKLTNAASFVADYKSKFGADPYPYSAMSFDAAMIEIQAMKQLISAGQPVTRQAIRDIVGGTSFSYSGVTGTIKFDQFGDNSGSKIYSVWAVLPTAPTAWTLQQNVDACTVITC